jgi:hypothetical protein
MFTAQDFGDGVNDGGTYGTLILKIFTVVIPILIPQ